MFLRKMPLQVAAIVKNADDVDHVLSFAVAVDYEVPGIADQPKRRTGTIAAETEVVDQNTWRQILPLPGTGTFRILAMSWNACVRRTL